MKVLVPVKRLSGFKVKVPVKSDGSGVDRANAKMSMNPFDEIAVEEAIRLKERRVVTEIVVVLIGVKQAQDTLRTALVAAPAKGYSHIAAASTAFAKSVPPRMAALLDVTVLSDVTAVVDSATFDRPVYVSNAIQMVKSDDPVKVFTVRTASFMAAAVGVLVGGTGLSTDGGADGGLRPAGADQRADRGLRSARRWLEG